MKNDCNQSPGYGGQIRKQIFRRLITFQRGCISIFWASGGESWLWMMGKIQMKESAAFSARFDFFCMTGVRWGGGCGQALLWVVPPFLIQKTPNATPTPLPLKKTPHTPKHLLILPLFSRKAGVKLDAPEQSSFVAGCMKKKNSSQQGSAVSLEFWVFRNRTHRREVFLHLGRWARRPALHEITTPFAHARTYLRALFQIE